MIRIDDEGREAILEALGTASVCWKETDESPMGQFDSEEVVRVADRLIARLERRGGAVHASHGDDDDRGISL